ncbi:MAG: SAM-dependent chlorinase/fluorinase [Bacteroidales bacterium]|nr:SAM-dependent chlorinase/fluorinase [Bacteroidales bacterium]
MRLQSKYFFTNKETLPVITLISDRNIDDFFIGRLKGKILSSCDDVNIIDLAHNIGHHSVSRAAFILKNSWRDFPDKTVHLIGVDSECNGKRKHLIAEINKQYFIASDNGLLSLVFNSSELQRVVKIEICKENLIMIPALFSFAEAACEIIKGKKLETFGKITSDIKRMLAIKPMFDNSYILGNLVYTDSYGNAISNISFDLFQEAAQGRRYKIFTGTSGYSINKISLRYQDVEEGDLAAVFNSLGLLEIAMNKGDLSKLMNFDNNTKIRIEFYD